MYYITMKIDGELHFYCGVEPVNPLDPSSMPAIVWDTDKHYAMKMLYDQAVKNMVIIKRFDAKTPAIIETIS